MLGSNDSKRSQRSVEHNDNHDQATAASASAAAAVDLIRNLDRALLDMNAAARSASENAARARRNAKAAGELARRYGGGKKLKAATSASGHLQLQDNADDNDNDDCDDNDLLEKTRERRSVARLAAEARHRRDNPTNISSSSPSSPRRLGMASTPTSIIFETSLFVAEDENENNIVTTSVEPSVVVDDNEELLCNDNIPSDHVRVASSEGFEDAMDHHHEEEECDAHPYPYTADGGDELVHTTNNDRNMQQYSYYNQQQNYNEQQQGEVQYQQYSHSSDMVHGQEGGGGGTDLHIQHQEQQQQQFYDNGGYYYPSQVMQNEQPQSHPSTVEAAASASTLLPPPPPPPPLNTHSQSTNTSRIEDSHVEDVLSLSLELERVRSQLATTVQQLTNATTQITTLKSHNDHLREELTTLHSQLEDHNERSIAQSEQLKVEQYKSKAAEEDALEALELAKESQSNKEELEMWLWQCVEDRDMWKGRCMELEGRLKEEEKDDMDTSSQAQKVETEVVEPKKVVRFKQNVEEDFCQPHPPPVGGQRTISTPRPPPPPPPPPPSSATATTMHSTSDSPARSSSDGTPNNGSIQLFTPTSSTAAITTTTPTSLDDGTPLSKAAAIASGRALLYRASVSSSPSVSSSSSTMTSPSPYKKQGLSPHPRMQAYDLLKKSAETRRLLRERLTPGRIGPRGGGGQQHHHGIIPLPKHIISSLSLNADGFASRQGAACKAVGRAIRESGERLKLHGTWWSSPSSHSNNDNDAVNDEINGLVVLPREYDIGERIVTSSSLAVTTTSSSSSSCNNKSGSNVKTVAELESMVREYCGKVENTIGQQQRKIDDLLAFCDHLEKGVIDMRAS